MDNSDLILMNIQQTIVMSIAVLLFALVFIKRRELIVWFFVYISFLLTIILKIIGRIYQDLFTAVSLFAVVPVTLIYIAVFKDYYAIFYKDKGKEISIFKKLSPALGLDVFII